MYKPEENDSVDGCYEPDVNSEDYDDYDYYYDDGEDLEDKMDRLIDKAIPVKS